MTILETVLAVYLGVLAAGITAYFGLATIALVAGRRRRAARKAILDDQLTRLRAAAAAVPDSGNVNSEPVEIALD